MKLLAAILGAAGVRMSDSSALANNAVKISIKTRIKRKKDLIVMSFGQK
jgi:hypothetical protein